MRHPARWFLFRPASLCLLSSLACIAFAKGQDLVRDATTGEPERVVNRQTIEDRQILDPQEAVQQVAGVVRGGSDNGYGEDFLIRGFQQQDLFKDGFRDGQNDSTNNAATGPTDIANIERSEFLKGPAAILYGRGEPGGIVNYVTRQAYFANDISLQQQFGSFNFYPGLTRQNFSRLSK